MKKLPRISESEWQVMKVLWGESPLTSRQIIEALSSKSTWKPKTIRTLLKRLLKKKAVGYKTKGRIFQYYPLVTEAECARAESHSFLHRVYNGTLSRMVATYLESEDLSAEEIEELKRILDQERRE